MANNTRMPYPYAYSAPQARFSFETLLEDLAARRQAGQRIVTTNGCFDLLHAGHAGYLQEARALGDVLVVGLNSDASVARLKGAGRPIMPEADRAALLAALRCVDAVVVFDDPLPTPWLEQVRPHIHCKAGDYTADSLPEAEVVRRHGGEVCILPFREGISTTQLLHRALQGSEEQQSAPGVGTALTELLEGANVLRQAAYRLAPTVEAVAGAIVRAIREGGKVLACGNGGSAADAQHFAAELVGSFRRRRSGWPAIALTVDSSVLTSLSNDYSYLEVFARQVEALGRPGDLLIAISTSGNSANVVAAVEMAHSRGMTAVALVGDGGSRLAHECEYVLAVPSRDTAYIQQAHIALLHAVCGIVERDLLEEAAHVSA